MSTREIKFVQFKNHKECTNEDYERYNFYPCYSEISEGEFYCGDDDYESRESVAWHLTMEDYYAEREIQDTEKYKLKYFILELIVNCDENDKPLWDVA